MKVGPSKEAIKFLEDLKNGVFSYKTHNRSIDYIINRLEVLEKLIDAIILCDDHSGSAYEVRCLWNEIEERLKYTIKKTIMVEIEAKDEGLLKNELNFFKAFLERNKDVLRCKYKIRESD